MKIKSIILLVLITLLFTGCGKNNTMSCKIDNSDDRQYSSIVDIEYRNDIVINATATMKFENDKAANNMCSIFKSTSDAKDNLTCDGKNITMKNYHKSVSNEKVKLDDFIEYLENQNYVCHK